MEEKRKSIRIKKLLTVQYSRESRSWDMTHIKDLSESGMQITTTEHLSPNETLTFRIKFPLRPFDWLELKGTVIESTDLKKTPDSSITNIHIARVKFVDLKDQQKELIREYVGWFLKQEGGAK